MLNQNTILRPFQCVLYIHVSLKCHNNLANSTYLAQLQLTVQIELWVLQKVLEVSLA